MGYHPNTQKPFATCACGAKTELHWWWAFRQTITCRSCHKKQHKAAKDKNRKRGRVPTPSKPLAPGGSGYSFRPDKMPCPSERHFSSRSSNERYKWNCRTEERKYRKRQRRVDLHFIKAGLQEIGMGDLT